MPKKIFIDRTGQTFSRLTVLEKDTANSKKRTYFKCKCSCGNIVSVCAGNLVGKKTRSCGCLKTEKITTHGKSKTPEYNIYRHMIDRCYNPDNDRFKNYGGRGITVCKKWRQGFMEFYRFVGPRPSKKHSIDRIDTDGNYEPGNVRWASQKTQSNNTRTNHSITINGKTMNAGQWAEYLNIPKTTFIMRIRRGWPPEKVISRKVMKRIDFKNLKVTVDGETKTLPQWAKTNNIKYATLTSRIRRGWGHRKAVTHNVRIS